VVERVERRARRRGWRSPAETASRRDPAPRAGEASSSAGNRLHEPGRCRQRRAKDGDSSLNSTIPELPGSGWLAAEPEATPQTHRLRPWGFPTCHPTLGLATKSDGVFRRGAVCGTMQGHWAIKDAPYMEVHACLLLCRCRFARRSGCVTNGEPQRSNWPRPSIWPHARCEGCCSGDARKGWKAWRRIDPDPTRPASRNTRRSRQPCICVSSTPVGELA
jgi:hypothetical protein